MQTGAPLGLLDRGPGDRSCPCARGEVERPLPPSASAPVSAGAGAGTVSSPFHLEHSLRTRSASTLPRTPRLGSHWSRSSLGCCGCSSQRKSGSAENQRLEVKTLGTRMTDFHLQFNGIIHPASQRFTSLKSVATGKRTMVPMLSFEKAHEPALLTNIANRASG